MRGLESCVRVTVRGRIVILYVKFKKKVIKGNIGFVRKCPTSWFNSSFRTCRFVH